MYEPVWHRPASVDEVTRLLAQEGERARLIAGGTDLAVRISSGNEVPPVLIDLGRVDDLSRVDVTSGRAMLGATATHGAIVRHGELIERASVLAEACRSVGSPQIRARGTIGGNVANGSPAADGSVALLALDAVAHVSSHGRSGRDVPLSEFWTGPGSTVLGSGELLETLEFEMPSPGSRSAYTKAGQRNALAIAIVSVAGVFDPSDGRIRLALGSVAPTPVRAESAESLFAEGWSAAGDRDAFLREVAGRAVEATTCIDDVRATATHRRRLTRALVERTLTRLCAG
jgi:carbon-monoxide dehydrogenase medium subunit